jgi:hypothetical protein
VAIERRWADWYYSVRAAAELVYTVPSRSDVAPSHVMQPTAANPAVLVFFINLIMTGKATAKEQELQGALGGHVTGAWLAGFSRDGGGDDAADVGDTTQGLPR